MGPENEKFYNERNKQYRQSKQREYADYIVSTKPSMSTCKVLGFKLLFLYFKENQDGGDPNKEHLYEMGTFVAADAEEKQRQKRQREKDEKRYEYDKYRVSTT